MRTYKVWVIETYEKCYCVEADDEFQAQNIADNLASNDFDITSPENMTNRDFEGV